MSDSERGIQCDNTSGAWRRKCPTCDIEIEYKYKSNYLKASRENCKCKYCRTKETNLGRKPTLQARLNMSRAQTGRKHSEETKSKVRGPNNGMYGVYRCGKENPFYGKRHTEETRIKMRLAMCRKILQKSQKTGRIANVNPKEKPYFEKLEVDMGWDGIFYGKNSRQALLEIGYFVDYYEPTLNIVVEYDEPKHYRYGVLRPRDVERMDNIKRLLGCRFLRYNERTATLVEY